MRWDVTTPEGTATVTENGTPGKDYQQHLLIVGTAGWSELGGWEMTDGFQGVTLSAQQKHELTIAAAKRGYSLAEYLAKTGVLGGQRDAAADIPGPAGTANQEQGTITTGSLPNWGIDRPADAVVRANDNDR